MAPVLPPVARFIFNILEPLSLLAGFLDPILNTSDFVSSQLPSTSTARVAYTLTPTDRVLALQLGNVYGLIGMIGVAVLYTTAEPKVVRNYLIACAIADVGHLWAICTVMGYTDFVTVWEWNMMAWGNIGMTTFLFVSRILYLCGELDEDEDEIPTESKKGMKMV